VERLPASATKYPALEATTFQPIKLGGGNQAFVLHPVLGAGEPEWRKLK
jgi:hypothetical protein